MNPTILEQFLALVGPSITQLLQRSLDEDAAHATLRREVTTTIKLRIRALEAQSHKVVELEALRTVAGLLPHLNHDALLYLAGRYAIDGRSGDYIEPMPLRTEASS